MFLYESKKPAASTKAVSSNKSADLVRRLHFNSSACPNNGQELNFIIQKCPIPTAIPPTSGFAAGSARPPQNQSPQDFSGSDADYILDVLSKNNWRENINYYEKDPVVRRIFDNWRVFLPQFLTRCSFKSFGANQSLNYHRPGNNTAAVFPKSRDRRKSSKLSGKYKGSSGLRERRRYTKREEIKRYLRHLAAEIALVYGIESEIQCYFDDEEQTVYIAVNTPNDEKKLSGIKGKTFSICFDDVRYPLRKTNDRFSFRGKAGSYDSRLSDRKSKLYLRRLRHNLPCPVALRKAKFKLIKGSEVNAAIPGSHTERKILYHLRSQKKDENFFLDPLRLGGIRRPCFICAALCFENMSQVRPGPCWVSGAASTPKNIKEMFLILDAIRNNENITYVSVNNEKPTQDNDTESSEGSECGQYTN